MQVLEFRCSIETLSYNKELLSYREDEESSSSGKTIFPGWRKRNKSATDVQLLSAVSSLGSSHHVSDSNSVSSDASRNVSRAKAASPALRRRSCSEETPGAGTIGSLESLFKAAVP